MSLRKIGIMVGVFSAVIFLSGCGKNKATDNSQNGKKNQNTEAGKNVSTENLPEATGKVDDTVDAIIDGANKEGDQAVSDDNDAKSAASSNSQTVDDIGKEL